VSMPNDVAYWYLADILAHSNVAFAGKADMDERFGCYTKSFAEGSNLKT
jgi:hypothetical protein